MDNENHSREVIEYKTDKVNNIWKKIMNQGK